MKITLVSCALIAGVVAAAVAAPMQFSKLHQEVTEKAPISTPLVQAPSDADGDITASIREGFTCEQIRIMDEVEFITDDSYCSERG